jgi:hypothetical protein
MKNRQRASPGGFFVLIFFGMALVCLASGVPAGHALMCMITHAAQMEMKVGFDRSHQEAAGGGVAAGQASRQSHYLQAPELREALYRASPQKRFAGRDS